MDLQPPPLFARGPAPLVRLMFFILFASFLMVLDARFRYAEALRQSVAIVVYPLQRAVLVPFQAMSAINDYFTSKTALERENAELLSKQLQIAKDQLALEALAAENVQLRKLLEARARVSRSTQIKKVVT